MHRLSTTNTFTKSKLCSSALATVLSARRLCHSPSTIKTNATAAAAAAAASSSTDAPKSTASSSAHPLDHVASDLKVVKSHFRELVRPHSGNDILDKAAQYLLANPGKMVRPGLVCLLGYCALPLEQAEALRSRDVSAELTTLPKNVLEADAFHRQLRLAEVTELIHTASLIHDDVIDEADTRRGKTAVHLVYGNKTAILAGDFLLSRASHWIATLNCNEVVFRMTRALEDLTTGELLQHAGVVDVGVYMEKTYCKTASLLDNSLASVAILCAGEGHPYVQHASTFGRHLGIAFQIVDDCLDFTGDEEALGKPKNHDMKSGIATLPVLLAAEHDTAVADAVQRRFTKEGDEELVMDAVTRFDTVRLAQARAWGEYEQAMTALRHMHPSPARDVLESASQYVLTRNK
eukprot:PhM_4_TR6284/c2_g1_i2/m.93899